MALIKCYECEKEISDKAPACPHCGCPVASGRPASEDTRGHPAPVNEMTATPEAGFWGLYWYLRVLKKYAVFSGRARRKEFWSFEVFSLLTTFALKVVENLLGLWSYTDESVLASIYGLGILIPSIAVGIRRMHDSDHSGWFILVPFYNLYLLFIAGTRGTNRFGDDPRMDEQRLI